MYSSQAINPKNADIYATFDRMWSEDIGIVTGNNGRGPNRPELIFMGSGSYMPYQNTEERGIWLEGGQYCFADYDFDADSAFSIAILTDSPMKAIGWLAATFRSDTSIGVRFGASAAGTLYASLSNAGGSITQTMVDAVRPSREKRLYVLTYDGSGSPGGLEMHVDGLTMPSVGGGTTVSGSLSSGKDLMFGCQSDGVNPAQFLVGRVYGVAVYPFILDRQMRLILREKMARDVKASYPANYYTYQELWSPAMLVQPGDSWLWADLDAAGAVTQHTQPVAADLGFDDAADWEVSDPSVSVAGSQILFTVLPSTQYCRQLSRLITGNRYVGTVDIDSSNGTVFAYHVGYTGITGSNSPGVKPFEYTSVGTSWGFGGAGGLTAALNSCTAPRNLSINQLTCKGNLGNLAQATPANMPWSSDADAPTSVMVNGKRVVYFDGVTDTTVGNQPASAYGFHKAAGFTCSVPFRAYADGAISVPFSTCSGAAASTGIRFFAAAGNKVQVRVCNGSGANYAIDYVSTATLLAGWHVLSVTWSQVGGIVLRIDTAAQETGATANAASAGDASAELYMFYRTNPITHGQTFIKTGAVSATDLLKLHNWMRSYYAL